MSLDNSSASHANSSALSEPSSYNPTNSTLADLYFLCASSPEGSRGVRSYTAYSVVQLVVLFPLCSFVLYRGYRRWRRQTTASHSDVITYHMAVLEMTSVLSMLCLLAGTLRTLPSAAWAGMLLFMVVVPCRLLLHCLTCAERYLAAVHPVVYLGLKGAGGARARNVCVGCVWLFGVGWMGVLPGVAVATPHNSGLILLSFIACFYAGCTLVIAFCSGAVLRALVRPPPGGEQEVGGRKAEGGNRLRRRAFRIIVVISLVLMVNLVSMLVAGFLLMSSQLSFEDMCATLLSAPWSFVPSSLVLPLMFLYRTGPTSGCVRTKK